MKKIILLLPTITLLLLGLTATYDANARAYYSGRLIIKDPDDFNPTGQRWWHASAYLSYEQKAVPTGNAEMDDLMTQVDIPINVSAASLSLCQSQFIQAKNTAMSLNTGVSSWISQQIPCQQ